MTTSRHLWVALMLLGFAGACSAREGNPLLPTALSSTNNISSAERVLAVSKRKIRFKPRSLTLSGTGPTSTKSVVVMEKEYMGRFNEASSCAGIAKASPRKGHGPRLMVKVTGVAVGMCAIVFSDTHKNKARLPIKVVANLVGVYVADTDNNAVKKVAPDGTITTIGSGFGYPNGVAVDTLGNVYVADTHNNAIKKVAPNGSLTPIGSAFNGPYGVAVDSSGDVYVADTFNNAVKVVAPNGTITCVPATFTLSNCGTAGFSSPSGVAVEPNCSANCNVYVADDGNNAVKMVAPNGTITSIGSGFNHPDGVAVDAIGNVYVADSLNGAVKKVATNEVISCVPSTLTLSNCSTAGFKYPRGVAVDALGNVYVADTYNSAVRMVAPSGAIMVIGSGFNYPYSVTLDAARDPF